MADPNLSKRARRIKKKLPMAAWADRVAGWAHEAGWTRSLAVDAHIYRHSLAISMSQGMLITVGLLAVTYVLMQFVFGTP